MNPELKPLNNAEANCGGDPVLEYVVDRIVALTFGLPAEPAKEPFFNFVGTHRYPVAPTSALDKLVA